MISLLEADGDLGCHLDVEDAAEATRRSVVHTIRVARGRWTPAQHAPVDRGLIGLFVLDGLLVRCVTLADHRSADLVMSGDVIRPFEDTFDGAAMVPSEVEWRVLEPVTLALLDSRLVQEMCAYPQVIAALAGRAAERTAVLAQRLAITHQPRVSARLWLLLWQLAERSGVVTGEGVLLKLRLTQALLAELVIASRPRVSDAIQELKRERLAWQTQERHWWLSGVPPEGPPRSADVKRSLSV